MRFTIASPTFSTKCQIFDTFRTFLNTRRITWSIRRLFRIGFGLTELSWGVPIPQHS